MPLEVSVSTAVLLFQGRARCALSSACGVFLSLTGTGIAGLVPVGRDRQAGKSLPALWSPAAQSLGQQRQAQLEPEGSSKYRGYEVGFQTLVAALPGGLLWAEQGSSPASLAKSQNLPQLITWLSN